jgi:hypothetical protein
VSVVASAMAELSAFPATPDLALAARGLIAASKDMDDHRAVNGYPERDPVGDDLQANLDEARRLFRSACDWHGIDADELWKGIL